MGVTVYPDNVWGAPVSLALGSPDAGISESAARADHQHGSVPAAAIAAGTLSGDFIVDAPGASGVLHLQAAVGELGETHIRMNAVDPGYISQTIYLEAPNEGVRITPELHVGLDVGNTQETNTGRIAMGGSLAGLLFYDRGQTGTANSRELYNTVGVLTTPALMHIGNGYFGAHPVHGASWTSCGHWNRQGTSEYQLLLHDNGEVLINSGGSTQRIRIGLAGTPLWTFDSNGFHTGGKNIVLPTGALLQTKAWNDTSHYIAHNSSDDGHRYSSWNYHRFWATGAERFRIQSGDGAYLYAGWFRPHGGYGLYFQDRGTGILSNINGEVIGYGTESRLVMHKTSQGGYSSSGLESRGTSTAVPHVSFHSTGNSAAAFRKDSSTDNLVAINQSSGCTNLYASSHPTCSARGLKHNVSLVPEYGLKTLRTLEVKRFQYHPVMEDQIWATLKFKDEIAAGKWPYYTLGDPWDEWHVGFMAEEVANLVPEAVGYNADGDPYGVDYGKLVVVAIAAINELADRVEELERRLYAHAA